jgi:hypothetical protein
VTKIALEQIRIASPCNAAWEEMDGDQRSRFCKQCELNVHNISDMSREEAESFLMEATGRVCVRMYRRADGTILTQDCPVGVRAFRVRVGQMVASAVAMFGVLVCSVSYAAFGQRGKERASKTVESLIKMTEPEIVPAHLLPMMGDVCILPAAPPITPPPITPPPITPPPITPLSERITNTP